MYSTAEMRLVALWMRVLCSSPMSSTALRKALRKNADVVVEVWVAPEALRMLGFMPWSSGFKGGSVPMV